MKIIGISTIAFLLAGLVGASALADVDAAEIYCNIENNHLTCQWVGKEVRRSLTPDDTAQFIDRAQVAAYLTVRSRKHLERSFLVDADAPAFRKLSDIKKTGSISEVAKAKLELFAEIERKVIKISDDLDAQTATTELVKYDPSVDVDKAKHDIASRDEEIRNKSNEIVTLKGNLATVDANQPADTSGTFEHKFVALGGIGGVLNSTQTDYQSNYTWVNLALNARANWSDRWSTEIETRLSSPVTTYYAGSAAAGIVTPSELTLIGTYWWNDNWGAGLDISDDTIIGLGNTKQTGTARIYQAYTDTFYGVGLHYRAHLDRNALVYAHASYQIGTGNVNSGGAKPSGDALYLLTANYERTVTGHHGIAAQLGLESIDVNGAQPGQNAITAYNNIFSNVFYKYSF